jgi:hypothetical protein
VRSYPELKSKDDTPARVSLAYIPPYASIASTTAEESKLTLSFVDTSTDEIKLSDLPKLLDEYKAMASLLRAKGLL